MNPPDFLPYARQLIDEDDIAAVNAVLASDWLTTGPAVEAFEVEFASIVGARHAIVCNSGTSALYIAARAAGLKSGDAVIVPSITFLATANANELAGVNVIFSDVDPDTGLMSVRHAADALRRGGPRVKAIYPVHMGGRVDDPIALQNFAGSHGLVVIEDACHALGTQYGNARHRTGACSHSLAACFSFHPTKTIAMGEGGAVTTNSDAFADRARLIRNHGMTRDTSAFANAQLAFAADGGVNPWYYEAHEISYNFRASDINCALGLSQLRKLDSFLETRRRLAQRYEQHIASLGPAIRYVAGVPGDQMGWHLCTVLIDFTALGMERRTLMDRLKAAGVGTQVHYIPVHLQPYYRSRLADLELPGAMRYYQRTLSLPLHAGMNDSDVDRVIDRIAELIS